MTAIPPAEPNSLAAHRPRPRVARRRPNNLVITYSPTKVLAFLCLLGTGLVPMLGSKGALLFLVAGMALIVARPGETLAAMRRSWLLLALTLWCLISLMWSDYPPVTIRYGIQLMMTVAIAVTLADRLPPSLFIKLVLAVQLIASILSLGIGRARADGAGYLGIYASKNALAAASGIMVIVSVAVLFDPRMTRKWRLLACAGLASGGMLLLMAKSTGALLAVVGTIGIFGVLYLLRRLSGPLRLLVLAMAVLLSAAVIVFLTGAFDQLSQQFLNATGKDLTLTGRTDLWARALSSIAERPFLGVGYQAFWVWGNPAAEELWAEFGIATRVGFNFHNTLISNAVEIGLIGALMQAVLFYGALWSALGWAIRSPSAASIFFALFMVRQFVLMQVELVFFFQFDFASLITMVAIYHAAGYRRAARAARRAGRWRMPEGKGAPPPPAAAPRPDQWPRARDPIVG